MATRDLCIISRPGHGHPGAWHMAYWSNGLWRTWECHLPSAETKQGSSFAMRNQPSLERWSRGIQFGVVGLQLSPAHPMVYQVAQGDVEAHGGFTDHGVRKTWLTNLSDAYWSFGPTLGPTKDDSGLQMDACQRRADLQAPVPLDRFTTVWTPDGCPLCLFYLRSLTTLKPGSVSHNVARIAKCDKVWWFQTFFYFSIQLGMSSSQLTFIFFRGVGSTTNQYLLGDKQKYTTWLTLKIAITGGITVWTISGRLE